MNSVECKSIFSKEEFPSDLKMLVKCKNSGQSRIDTIEVSIRIKCEDSYFKNVQADLHCLLLQL